MGKLTKNQILEISYQEFLDIGYEKTTLRHLSSKLNVTHGNILYHFKSKDYIALDILRKYFDLWFISSDIFSDPETRKRFNKNYVFQTIVHFSYMVTHPEFARFYTDFLRAGSSLFVDQFKTYFTNFVDSLDNTDYFQRMIKQEMDVLLIVEANTKLVSFILNGQTTVREASVYLYNLLNLFWDLGKSISQIEEEVEKALHEQSRVEKVSKFIETEMLRFE